MVARSSISRVATRAVARRQMSSVEPKMHTSKTSWQELKKTRPPKDHMDEHLVFHPPYNGVAVCIGVFTVFALGYGTMGVGLAHQQYKQGFWK